MSLSFTAKHAPCLQLRGLDLGSLHSAALDAKIKRSSFWPQRPQSSTVSGSSYKGTRNRPCHPRCAFVTAAEFGQSSSEPGFFQKLATVWNIFFPPPKKKISARAMAKNRLLQTLGEEEFGLTRQQISAIGQQIGRVLEDFVELEEVPGEEAPVLQSKLEGRGRLKVMFKVRRVKPSAEDGWFGDEDSQEWSPYMADDAEYVQDSPADQGPPSFEDSLRLRGKEDTIEWLDSDTVVFRRHDMDSD